MFHLSYQKVFLIYLWEIYGFPLSAGERGKLRTRRIEKRHKEGHSNQFRVPSFGGLKLGTRNPKKIAADHLNPALASTNVSRYCSMQLLILLQLPVENSMCIQAAYTAGCNESIPTKWPGTRNVTSLPDWTNSFWQWVFTSTQGRLLTNLPLSFS